MIILWQLYKLIYAILLYKVVRLLHIIPYKDMYQLLYSHDHLCNLNTIEKINTVTSTCQETLFKDQRSSLSHPLNSTEK